MLVFPPGGPVDFAGTRLRRDQSGNRLLPAVITKKFCTPIWGNLDYEIMELAKLESGETLEVLAPSPSPPMLAVLKLKHYVVRLRHELGVVLVVTPAADHRAAIDKVIAAAQAPPSSVISVQKIRWKDGAVHTRSSSLRNLKYVDALR